MNTGEIFPTRLLSYVDITGQISFGTEGQSLVISQREAFLQISMFF